MSAGRDASLEAALAAIKQRRGGDAIGQPGHQLTPNPDLLEKNGICNGSTIDYIGVPGSAGGGAGDARL